MLVLSRKSREAVVVGGADGLEQLLKVTVLEISRGKVRLGFEAPAAIPVYRWEVWERIRAIAGPVCPPEPRTDEDTADGAMDDSRPNPVQGEAGNSWK